MVTSWDDGSTGKPRPSLWAQGSRLSAGSVLTLASGACRIVTSHVEPSIAHQGALGQASGVGSGGCFFWAGRAKMGGPSGRMRAPAVMSKEGSSHV